MQDKISLKKIASVNIIDKCDILKEIYCNINILQSPNKEYLIYRVDDRALLVQIPGKVLLNMNNKNYEFCFSPTSKYLALQFIKLEEDCLQTIMIYNLQKRNTVWVKQFDYIEYENIKICFDQLDNLYIGFNCEILKITPDFQTVSQRKVSWLFNCQQVSSIVPISDKCIFVQTIRQVFTYSHYVIHSGRLQKIQGFLKQYKQIGEIFKNCFLYQSYSDSIILYQVSQRKKIRVISWICTHKNPIFLINHCVLEFKDNQFLMINICKGQKYYYKLDKAQSYQASKKSISFFEISNPLVSEVVPFQKKNKNYVALNFLQIEMGKQN